MNVRLISAIFALALPMAAHASYTGPCGGDWTDADGDRGSCSCDSRPQCEDDGLCECEFDQYCADTSCGSSAAIDLVVDPSSVRAWTPRVPQAEAVR